MADISKCHGEGCDKKYSCYRFTAKPDQWQSYISPEPDNCEYYWPQHDNGCTSEKCTAACLWRHRALEKK